MLFAPSRADLDSLVRALGLRAVVSELNGARAEADAHLDAARRVAELSPDNRRQVARQLLRRASVTGWPEPVAAAAREALQAGREAADAALAQLPADLALLLQAGGLDPLDVVAVHRRHGAVTGADIAAIVSTLEAGDPSQSDPALERVARHLNWLGPRRRRIALGRMMGPFERIEALLASLDSPVHVEPLGSVRRVAPTVGDLDLLLTHDDPPRALAAAVTALAPASVRHLGRTRAVLQVDGREVSLRAAAPADAAALLVWHTGTPAHVEQLRRHAATLGLHLRPDGLLDVAGNRVPCRSEAEIYASLGLPYIAPELRHGEDEIARAAAGTLPALVAPHHILGDLHTHTLWSDGRDSVDTMVFAARALGYQYVAITDHSPSAAATRVLTLERLDRQTVEVDRMRAAVPEITILHGVEVDILEDGSLDLPDAVMARLDIVLASLHEPRGQTPSRLLDRYASAMRHPLVNIVTHPANRMPGRDEGYALDFDALFRMAVETGTALEIDGGPGHLDLDGHLARRAVEAGVTLTIDSDAHDASRLGRQMRLGVGTARRGGVSPGQVLNTRPLEAVRAFFAEKRRRLA